MRLKRYKILSYIIVSFMKLNHNISKKTQRFPLRYIPLRLTKKDKVKAKKELLKSRKAYKKGVYYTRKKVASFHSKPSRFLGKAEKMYGVEKIDATKELANASGCSTNALAKIIQKGEGAYFSSGSRPNQTAQSWGIARLASALTAGKAAVVDYSILEQGCKPNSQGLKMAKKAIKKYGRNLRKSPKVA
jgi:hypothetical protein